MMSIQLVILLDQNIGESYTVSPSGCWLWDGPQNGHGYGRLITIRDGYREQMIASRAFYILFNGPIPDGEFVLHRCDTPLCVNPQHLFTGTQVINLEDMRSKGRWSRWCRWPYAQLEVGEHFIAEVPGTQWLYKTEWGIKLDATFESKIIGTSESGVRIYKVWRTK